jgi:hypothetical protein
MRLALIAGLAALAPCAALAAPPRHVGPADPPQCFAADRILDHKIADARTLYVETDRRVVFRVTMANDCMQSATSDAPLGVLQFGRSRVCKAKDFDVSVRGRRCVASRIEQLTKAEVAALPARSRP